MNLFRHIADEITAALRAMEAAGELPSGLDFSAITAEPPRDASHGDIATNAAMVLAKGARKKPREIADALVARLRQVAHVTEASVAGPGFINLRLADDFWRARLADVLKAGAAYGDSTLGKGTPVNVEYVSANPTGPLHVAHARGAVVGDALSNLLGKAGYAVTKEYYINDAGAQVDTLGRSTYLRYQEALGLPIGAIPEGLYPGEYLKDVGRKLAARDGQKWLNQPEDVWLPAARSFAIDELMDSIRADLDAMGVHMDVFTSERALVESGAVDAAFKALSDAGLIYQGRLEPPKGQKPDDWEDREQTLFRSTQFGDDVDRPLKKSDGSWTYFANDIANHYDKFRRGSAEMIDVWGADHGGYVKRQQAAVKAITAGKGALDVKLCQLVRILKGGELVRMSKRAGTFVTLRDLLDEVGPDVVRFTMLTRKNDAPFDFDLEKATEQSRDNPVWYVQYAHARTRSVLRQAAAAGFDQLDAATLAVAPHGRLVDAGELALIKLLAQWPRQVEAAAQAHEPHRIAFYLYELASQFHAHWNRGKEDSSLRFVVEADRDLTLSRIALVQAVGFVIQSGLGIFGVPPAEEMR
ncbi:arginine--tRNA ligase [Reyranella sp. CPCC 100927]|uniref:arginine--tRNA ligase n=1 Tax=Reyranella sp. CPCC 100927 TaxID=2599616 RepID=UPI0011B56D87|nr:arginine--tRNA ligase [Reyranella sp. CPCC 100927]TWT06024.1 arginine--tRNA ligase [Reyranella sp. CPCC 100927]